jgi:hypothetical protein
MVVGVYIAQEVEIRTIQIQASLTFNSAININLLRHLCYFMLWLSLIPPRDRFPPSTFQHQH